MKTIRMILIAALLMMCLPMATGAAVSETDDGIIYRVEKEEVVVEGFNYAGTVMRIPETIEGMPVRRIAPYACRGNHALTEVRIPGSVREIGEYAFAECKNLMRVGMEEGVEEIGFSAFRDSAALRNVTLPASLKRIGDSAFQGCVTLGSLTIGEALEEIGEDAFTGCGALRLKIGNNQRAEEYAARYGIPTDFRSTWGFTVLMTVVVTLPAAAALFALDRFLRKRRREGKA